jgi:hypothetical protein
MDHSQQQGNFRRQLDDLSLALLAQLFDLVAAVNGLPERGLLWAGRLSQTTAASLHFLASVIGLYKALI